MENFLNWDTLALVRLARILKVTEAVQSDIERKELSAVMAELVKRDAVSLIKK